MLTRNLEGFVVRLNGSKPCIDNSSADSSFGGRPMKDSRKSDTNAK